MQPQIDLLLWSANASQSLPDWSLGDTHVLPSEIDQANASLQELLSNSTAEYMLFWDAGIIPSPDSLVCLIETGGDVFHAGLVLGLDRVFQDLNLYLHTWSMINSPADRPNTSWRLSLDACLIRCALLRQIGTFDSAFISREGAGLELGFRCLGRGAIIEHRPELLSHAQLLVAREPPLRDLYAFILRYNKQGWAWYVALRRMLRMNHWQELRILRDARTACAVVPVAGTSSFEGDRIDPMLAKVPRDIAVSVIIPTLGRYPYLPEALASLRQQTISPLEVIIVDQNPVTVRQPEIYEGYADLNLRVIWQDQQGQSLARNTGLAASHGKYVLLFDDDSIAQEDLIETHLCAILDGRFDVSTGVSYPPPPHSYKLPPSFRYPRLAQTFDTGNSLLPLALAQRLDGLDRNYDFGPGTDLDFGTRLYLAGQRILHNPAAVRIHYKAPMGGLRTYGVHKYNTDAGLIEPFPPVTQSYYGLRYLTPAQRRERMLIQFVTSHFPHELRGSEVSRINRVRAIVNFIVRLVLLPIKWHRSQYLARMLLHEGVQLASFDNVAQAVTPYETLSN